MCYFNTEEANRLFDIWVKSAPESFVDTDMDCFTRLAICLFDNDELLDIQIIKEAFCNRLTDEIVTIYWSRYSSMRDMYKMLSDDSRLVHRV